MSADSKPLVFESATCTAPAGRAARTRDEVLRHAATDRRISVLDVGCGTGVLLFHLADALPLASLSGIDISPANIREAETQRTDHRSGNRMRFIQADYLDARLEPVDVIVTDTALHFIRGDATRLWTKLSGDLRPGGVLVCCMAYDCGVNRAIRGVRRVLRGARSRPVDALVQGAGRLVYGGTLEPAQLRERTEYMYIPPEQLMTAAIRDRLAPSLGLRCISEHDVPGTSITQLRQRTTVFAKPGTEVGPGTEIGQGTEVA